MKILMSVLAVSLPKLHATSYTNTMRPHSISFFYAFRGIWTALTTQLNLRLHFLIGSLVLILAVYLQLPLIQILILILTIMHVVATEMFNTALEFMGDGVTLEHRDFLKHAKDISAGGVLLSAIFAIIVGLIIFVPPLLNL